VRRDDAPGRFAAQQAQGGEFAEAFDDELG
jgi:hypothetical protein